MTKIRTPETIFRDSQSRTSFALMASSICRQRKPRITLPGCPAARLPCNGLSSAQSSDRRPLLNVARPGLQVCLRRNYEV